ncbi:NUDIX hydrolase [Chelativorans sp. YIM 93263]|uniref:NUDIX hydrolase n=1 Tax=Chelativorans sp. YIM 93263 TaxID=2906648 RepID=UPI002378200C|nr:NUDIX hydrolase [Chelativorans sp. YIM 93263]
MGHIARINVLERLRQLFGGNPPHVQVAALPWRRGQDGVEIMLVTSRGTGRWVLPKGWPEGREELSEAASREALEEAGVEGRTDLSPIGHYFYGKETRTGLRRRCEVAVFPLYVEREAKRWREKKKRTRRWHPPEEASQLVEEPDLAELISEFAKNSTVQSA